MPRKRKANMAVEENVDAEAGAEIGDDGNNGTDVPVVDGKEQAVKHFTVPYNDKEITCERRGDGAPELIFTHGAGGGITAPATKEFADGFGEISPVVTYQGNLNLKSRLKMFQTVMEHEDFDAALGGRSMGARAAALSSNGEDRKTKALVLVSFPLVGEKGDSREQILLDLPAHIDVLFVIGSRDKMCDLEQLAEVTEKMKPTSWLVTVEGADHGMSWKHKSSVEAMRRKTGALAAEWLKNRTTGQRYLTVSVDEETGEIQCGTWAARQSSTSKQEADEPPAKKRKGRKKA